MRKNLLLTFLLLSVAVIHSTSYLYAQKPLFNYAEMLRLVQQQQAQYVEAAWLHQINTAFFQSALRQSSFFAIRNSDLFLKTKFSSSAQLPLTSTPYKLIYSRVSFQNIFSKPEKTLLLHQSAPLAKLGQIAFLHDRHATIFNFLSSNKALKESDIHAFQTHQENLQNLFQKLFQYYQYTEPEKFSSFLFPKEKIQMMAQEPSQPPAYVLSTSEIKTFAQLPDLASQRQWTYEHLQNTYQFLGSMQEEAKGDFNKISFENYYLQKMRYDYFQELYALLEQTTQKRLSLITRYKLRIGGEGAYATDAERLGYIRFQADVTHDPQLQQQFQSLLDVYAPYASAEVFGKPYEFTLEKGAFSPYLLSNDRGIDLPSLSYEEALRILPAQIDSLQKQIETLHDNPSTELSFYKRYYYLTTQADIYRSYLAKAKFFLNIR